MGGKMTQAPATPSLVERLRSPEWGEFRSVSSHVLCQEAADALEAQQARIAELEAERDEARDIVAWCNNSLFGSHGYFTAASGKTASEAIEDLKAASREQWRRSEASQALADRYEKALRFYANAVVASQHPDRLGACDDGWAARQALSSQGRHEGGEG